MKKTAGLILTILFSLTTVFHLLIISRIIPCDIVWGGRLKTKAQMIVFEIISLLLNTLFMLIILLKTRQLKLKISTKTVNVLLWIMFGIFLLNTLGNLFSESITEKLIFTPITLLTAVLILILNKR